MSEQKQLKERIALLEAELEATKLAKQALEKQLVQSAYDMAESFRAIENSQISVERYKKQKELSDSFMETAFNTMDTLVIITDIEGTIVRVNSAAMKGATSQDITPHESKFDKAFEFCDQNQNAVGFDQVKREVSHAKIFAKHVVICNKKDKKYSYFLRAAALFNKFGQREGVIITGVDVTQLERQQTALETSETVLSLLLNSANDAIIVIDPKDEIKVWNKKSEELFGWSAEEIVGLKFHDYVPSKSDRAAYLKNQASFAKTGEGKAINATRELHAYRKDGSKFEAEVSISSGKIEGEWHAFGVIRDVTERNKTHRLMIEAKNSAEKANAAKSEFLATMSHEIRTPLNGIMGMIHLLKKTKVDDVQRDYLNKAEVSADTLLAIINDILDFSKVEAGMIELENKPFSLRTVLDTLKSTLAQRAQSKGIAFNCEIKDDTPVDFVGDVVRLNQVLLNLSSNAIKFTNEGWVNVEIACIADKSSSCLLKFKVTDSGIGIAKDNLPKLFKSFVQEDSSTTRRFGGTGLGLAISQKLVGLMGSEISVTSVKGEGSQFEFDIELEKNLQVITRTQKTKFSRRLDIVVLDDNAINLELIEQTLTEMGANVTCFQYGDDARAHLRSRVPDVLLVDWRLQDETGISFVSKLAEEVKLENTIKILMSFYDTEELTREAGVNLFQGIIYKPIKSEELLEIIDGNKVVESEGKKSVQQSTTSILEGKHVLIVDDSDMNLFVAEEILDEYNMLVDTASNGQEAVDKVIKNSYDLILMDIHMPVLDGVGATRVMRENGLKIPIIALTADVMSKNVEGFLAEGMNDVLSKPLDPEKLIKKLRRYLKAK